MEQPKTPRDSVVWVLTDDRPGNRTQALGAARALGLPFEEKRLQFNALQTTATPRLGATIATLDAASRALMEEPYPDLVIGAGKRIVPIARWIAKETGERAKVVLIGRRTPDGAADLTVRPAYLKQVQHPDLLELVLPITQVDPAALAAARSENADPLEGLASPRVVFLVGGPTGQHEFDAVFAGEMAGAIARATKAIGGGLAILTSRRTPPGGVDAIRLAAPEARVQAWSSNGGGAPYLAYLAAADLLVVTGESESMLAEAVAAEKPITIYPVPPKPLSAKVKLRGVIATLAEGGGPLAPLCRAIMSDGWVAPRRDMTVMHALMESHGWARMFNGALNRDRPKPFNERERLATAITKVMSERRAAA